MRRREPPRVVGPYQEKNRWRIVIVERGERKSFFCASREEALKLKSDFAKQVDPPPSRRLADVIMDWQQDKVRSGACKARSAQDQASRLSLFLGPLLDEEIATLTPRRAAALYERHTERTSRQTRRALSAATHRFDLCCAKFFFSWAIKQGYLGANPFKDVKPIGKVCAGKPQLRIEEARRFTETALLYFEENNEPLALGALLALTMGLRTSEVMNRVVRDLDDGARYLWIDEGKTKSARRHLEVPTVLRPFLLGLTPGKRPDELLFGVSPVTGRPRFRQAMYRIVQMICAKAEVPRVCTHSLRGLWATLAIQSGAVSHAVAESLGHHSFAVTQKHYAEPGSVTNAATARVLGMLAHGDNPTKLSAEELLKSLDEDTLDKFARLLSERSAKDKLGNQPESGCGNRSAIDPKDA